MGYVQDCSFRQMTDMSARIALAGGNARFVRLPDDFFGYGKPAATQPTDPHDEGVVNRGTEARQI